MATKKKAKAASKKTSKKASKKSSSSAAKSGKKASKSTSKKTSKASPKKTSKKSSSSRSRSASAASSSAIAAQDEEDTYVSLSPSYDSSSAAGASVPRPVEPGESKGLGMRILIIAVLAAAVIYFITTMMSGGDETPEGEGTPTEQVDGAGDAAQPEAGAATEKPAEAEAEEAADAEKEAEAEKAAEAEKPAAGGTTTYTVRQGDLPAAIAREHNITLQQLMQANPNANWSALKPGETKLQIPQ